MKRGARLVVALRAASRASAPPAATLVGIATLPLSIVGVTLLLVGFDAGVGAIYLGIALPVSVLAHEGAHAVVYAALWREGRDPAFQIRGRGTALGAHLIRGALPIDQDAAVALAGPVAGSALSLPLLLLVPVPWPWMLPLLAHLVSLLPHTSDGTQVALALRSERIPNAPG